MMTETPTLKTCWPVFEARVADWLREVRISEGLPVENVGDGESLGDLYTYVAGVRPSGAIALEGYYDYGDENGCFVCLGYFDRGGRWYPVAETGEDRFAAGCYVDTVTVRETVARYPG